MFKRLTKGYGERIEQLRDDALQLDIDITDELSALGARIAEVQKHRVSLQGLFAKEA